MYDLPEIMKGGGITEIPPSLQAWLRKPKQLFIDGRWRDGSEGRSFATVNPATEETLCQVAQASQKDIDDAVRAARRAFEKGEWWHRPLEERAHLLERLAEEIDTHRGPLAILESLDTGKPIRETWEGDIPRAAQNFRFFAAFGLSERPILYEKPGERHEAWRDPVGVAALVTPWNLPLYLETWKLAPALLMGNSCILKPSELTPLTAIYLAELAEAVGFPRGVFQVVQGFGEGGAGEWLVSHPQVDAISFTGETQTGRAIMKSAAQGPTRISFELGGKGASVVFADAPREISVIESVRAAFRNQGQICLANSRVFIEESFYDEFVEAFVAGAREIKVGSPLDSKTTMGALISKEHREKVLNYTRQLEPRQIAFGDPTPPEGKGYFLNPTVAVNLSVNHPISCEEVFGPVVSLYPFKTEADVVEAVNATPYGLSASVWTQDEARARRVAQSVRTGLVWVNSWFVRDLRVPFGGQKRSGVGREGGKHSFDFFSEWKSVCFKEVR